MSTFDTDSLREFAASLSDEKLGRECQDARHLLAKFDGARIRLCKERRLQERLQKVGGVGAMVLLVAATAGVGILGAAAFGGGYLCTKVAGLMTSNAINSACDLADERIQSLSDTDYLATFLILESRAAVFLNEQSRRQRKVEGGSLWSEIKSKANVLLDEWTRIKSVDADRSDQRPSPLVLNALCACGSGKKFKRCCWPDS